LSVFQRFGDHPHARLPQILDILGPNLDATATVVDGIV
jgi:hypothetical protein